MPDLRDTLLPTWSAPCPLPAEPPGKELLLVWFDKHRRGKAGYDSISAMAAADECVGVTRAMKVGATGSVWQQAV